MIGLVSSLVLLGGTVLGLHFPEKEKGVLDMGKIKVEINVLLLLFLCRMVLLI